MDRILELSSDGVFVIGFDGHIRLANRAAAEMHGYGPDELTDQPVATLVPPDARSALQQVLEALPRGEVLTFELPALRRDGTTFPAQLRIFPAGPAAPDAFLCLIRDTSDSVALEAQLSDAQERFASARRVARIGYWEWDPASDHIDWSDELYPIYGVTPETFAHTYPAFLQLIHPGERPALEAAVARTMATGEEYTVEHRVIRPDGEVRWCVSSGCARHGADGQLSELYGMSQDIDQIKRAEIERRNLQLQVQSAQKLESLGLLAGGIAHDFNNMLTGVLGNVSLVLADLQPESMLRDDLEAVEAAARRAADLCRQLLAYAGRGRFELAPLDVGQLVGELRDLLDASVSRQARLTVELGEELPAVVADAAQVRQILMNLVLNASEALDDQPGRVTVEVRAEPCTSERLALAAVAGERAPGTYLVLEVQDDGVGMTPEDQARVFDPFFTTKFTGRGLGMAAVLGIVRGHGGAVELESRLGEGTTVRVLLPAAEAARPVRVVTRPAWEGRKLSGTILLVDDDPIVRKTAAKMMRSLGLETLIARDGIEGLALFREHQTSIGAVLLDMTMPGLSGLDVFEALRELEPSVRVVLSSGYDQEDVANRFTAEGLSGFLQKPYRLSALADVLERALKPGSGEDPGPA